MCLLIQAEGTEGGRRKGEGGMQKSEGRVLNSELEGPMIEGIYLVSDVPPPPFRLWRAGSAVAGRRSDSLIGKEIPS